MVLEPGSFLATAGSTKVFVGNLSGDRLNDGETTSQGTYLCGNPNVIDLGKFHHDLTSRPKPGIMIYDLGKSSPCAALIQVSEILEFTQIDRKAGKVEIKSSNTSNHHLDI